MAIQKINLGTEPLGEGGDTYRSANTKINENFSNEEHAASRLVGKRSSNLVQVSDVAEIARSVAPVSITLPDSETDLSALPTGSVYRLNTTHPSYPSEIPKITSGLHINTYAMTDSSSQNTQIARPIRSRDFWIRTRVYGGGGNAYSNWAKIYTSGNTEKDSKSNLLLDSGDSIPSNSAASRLVGTKDGNVPEFRESGGVANSGMGGKGLTINTAGMETDEELFWKLFREDQVSKCYGVTGKFSGVAAYSSNLFLTNGSSFSNISIPHTSNNVFIHSGYTNASSGTLTIVTRKLWHDRNTKLDTNGALAPSSPTIDLYSDRIETNEDGAKMNPEFIRNGVGDYTIKNTTGLRDEGWYIKIPNDMNGNPKVAVTIDTDKDGNLSIKTYKRTFSMETFTFGPDLDEPLDIPEGRWIDLRFNDLPEEQLDEPEPVEEPLVDEVVEPEVVEGPEEPVEESK